VQLERENLLLERASETLHQCILQHAKVNFVQGYHDTSFASSYSNFTFFLVEDTPRAPAIACDTRARSSLLVQPLAVQSNARPSTLCRAGHVVEVSTHWAPS
jgi:hypothetical protein